VDGVGTGLLVFIEGPIMASFAMPGIGASGIADLEAKFEVVCGCSRAWMGLKR